MQQLIRFRLLADSLSQNEFNSFALQLFKKRNKKTIILAGLFYLFQTQIQNESNNSDLTEASNIISKIIHSRNTKQLKEIESKKESKQLSLNDLPYPIIGECASYLQFMDYHSLQKISRRVFIGCNDPNTLTTINKNIFSRIYKSKQYLKLIKYQKVKDFYINVDKFSKMTSIHNLSLSRNTKSLELFGTGTAVTACATMKTFLKTKCWNFNKIEVLKLHKFVDSGTFCDLLKHFKNIKYLELQFLFLEDGFDVIFNNEPFRNKIFNNLQGLCLFGYRQCVINFYDHLLHYFSDKLLSLHLNADIKCPQNGFINLKEVCIKNADSDNINNIIKTAKKLERVHLRFRSDYIHYNNKLEDILIELLNQKTLEFISIEIYFDLETIKNVLKKISFSKRKRLKIRICIQQKIKNANEYFEILKTKFREDGVIDDWMIIFIFPFVETMRKYTIGNNENYNIGDEVKLFLNNKQCKINGQKERWLSYSPYYSKCFF